jgi:formylmethanofuran dehydrogenase subunit E
MRGIKINLKEAVSFHGHLGPYLVLGLLAGEYALRKLNCKKYFGLEIKVWGADKKPKSCLIDGLQLSTGATYGKGNIRKLSGRSIVIFFKKKDAKQSMRLRLTRELINRLDSLSGHSDSEKFAKGLVCADVGELFNIQPKN